MHYSPSPCISRTEVVPSTPLTLHPADPAPLSIRMRCASPHVVSIHPAIRQSTPCLFISIPAAGPHGASAPMARQTAVNVVGTGRGEDDEIPHIVHDYVMGWKITTPKHKSEMLEMIKVAFSQRASPTRP